VPENVAEIKQLLHWSHVAQELHDKDGIIESILMLIQNTDEDKEYIQLLEQLLHDDVDSKCLKKLFQVFQANEGDGTQNLLGNRLDQTARKRIDTVLNIMNKLAHLPRQPSTSLYHEIVVDFLLIIDCIRQVLELFRFTFRTPFTTA